MAKDAWTIVSETASVPEAASPWKIVSEVPSLSATPKPAAPPAAAAAPPKAPPAVPTTAAPVTGVTPPAVVLTPPAPPAPTVTGVTPAPVAAPGISSALADSARIAREQQAAKEAQASVAPPAPVLKPAPVAPTSTASNTAAGMQGYRPGQGSREDQSLIDQQDIYWDRSQTGVVRYQPNPKFNAGMDEPGEVPLGKAKTREQALALVEAYKKKNPTAATVTGVTPSATPPAVPASGWPVGMNPKWIPDKEGSRTGPGRLEMYGKNAGRFNNSTEAFAEVAKQTIRIEQKASAPTVPTPAPAALAKIDLPPPPTPPAAALPAPGGMQSPVDALQAKINRGETLTASETLRARSAKLIRQYSNSVLDPNRLQDPGIMTKPAPAVTPPSEDRAVLNPDFTRAVYAQLNAIPKEQRISKLQALIDNNPPNTAMGRASRAVAARYKGFDASQSKTLTQVADPRLEAQTSRFMEQGRSAEDAQNDAMVQALQGQMRPDPDVASRDVPGELAGAKAEKTALDLKDANFAQRVGAEIKINAQKTALGLFNLYGDFTGNSDIVANAIDSQRIVGEAGKAIPKGDGIFEKSAQGAVTSLAIQAPMVLLSMVTGTAAPMLAQIGLNAFLSEYGEGRSQGLDPAAAAARSAQLTAAEIVFERFGMTKALAGLKVFNKNNPNASISAYFTKAIGAEVPAELATTLAQYAIDLEPGVGLTKKFDAKDLYERLSETLRQTIIQSGLQAGMAITGVKAANAITGNNDPARVLAKEINRGSDAVDQFLRQFEASPAGVNPNLKNVGNLSPPDSAGRVEPKGKVDISTAPGRAEPAGEVDLSAFPGRTDPEMTADELAKIVAPEVDKKAEPAEGQPYSQPFISNNRIVVIRDVNGVQVPFYISTGKGKKKGVLTGQWYPYFGNGEDGWFNKGSEEDINDFYGSPELKAVADQLNSSVGDIRDQMDTLPAAADVRVNPSADMNPVSLSGARTPEGDRLWRSNIANTLDRIKKGAAKPTDQASDEEMVSLDEFAIPSIERETVTGVTPETPAPTVTPVTPTNRVEYVAEVRRQLGNLQPGDVLENDAGDVWTVDDVMRNKAGEITGFLPREKNPENGKREVIDLDGAGSILLPSSYTDLDGNKKMSEPGRVNRARPENVGVTPVTPKAPAPEVAPEAPAVTPVTPKAKARPGARLAQTAYAKNPFLTFLARNGLYHEKGKPNSQKSEFSPDRSIMVPGFGPVFKKTGMLPDVMVQSAIEDGYLPFGATESDLTDLIRRAVGGERIAPLYAEGVADEEMARRIEANREANQPDDAPLEDDPFGSLKDDPFGPLDNDQISPPDSAITNLRQEVDNLTQEAEGLKIDAQLLRERADEATRGGTESDFLKALKTSLTDAIATPKLDLKAETPQETVAREATQDADRRAADQKKQVDNAVDFFELESQTQGKPEAPTEDMFAGEAGPSAEYKAADELANRAGAAFRQVQEAYRKQEIGDEDFLAGRKVYDTAMAAYDEALKKEQDKPTESKAADKKPVSAYTPEQRAEAETHAKETGGTIVWQEGDYALIRGFSVLSGDPVYVPTIGSNRGRVDIGAFTGTQIPDGVKKKMLEVKQDLEEKAALKHANDPFIVFDGGMAFSSDISGELAGVVRGWKDLLKLKPNLYISTVAAATENKDNFTGPHRRIGSATLDLNDRGSTRRMKDGSHYIVVTKSTSPTQMLEMIAHELGHIHEKEYFNQASPVEKEALKQAHATWVNSQKGKSAEELVESLRGRATARSMLIKAGTKADDLNPYWTSFGEWYADQTSRWAVTAKSPVTVVEKFFKRLALQLRLFYQRLHNAKYLPNETFVKYIEAATGNAVDLTPQDDRASKMSTGQGAFNFEEDANTSEMISSNNPVVAKTLNEVSQALPKAQKKLPPGRSPELAAAAQMVQDGTMTAKEYDALVNKYRPIPVYSAPLVPATTEQVFNALDSLKRQQVNPAIPEGTPVGLRLDIPSWNRSKTFVVSIHQQRPNNSSVGAVLGYASTAAIKNVTFALGNQKTTLKIATGQAKDAIQTMEGTYVPMTPAETTQRATEAFKSGDWVQVGIDPMRHSYFFDRRTTLPVIKADEVLQIGNMILAKGVTFGSKDNFLYNLDTTKPAPSTSDIRAVKIKEYAKLRARLNRVASTVAKGEVSIDVQRDTARLLGLTRELKEDIGYLAEPSTTPARFLSKALAEYDAGNISPEVLAVIQAAYNKTPWLLDGLRLSVRAAPGRGANASFAPLSRIVSLYKETSGVEEPRSIRHELTHSLEQMMTVAQRRVVIDAWLKSMQLAIKNNPDQEHQTYFQAVMDHMENPTEKTRQAAIDAMPSYSMYQFINPSEFWAVNAESLMGQQLGAYWERFKKSMHTLLEGLKLVFGFDNRYAVHKTFNDIMNGSKARLNGSSLAEYVSQNQDSTTLLESRQDDEDLLKKHQQSHTPMLNTFGVLKNFALKTAAFTKDMFKTLVTDPKSIPDLVMTGADKSLTFARNKLLWFGTGLNDADRIKYGGELLTAQDMATGSLALDNALRGGSIGVQVLFEGGIKFDSASQNFVAVKTAKGMTNVYKAQAELKKKLGDQLGEDIIQSYLEAKRSRSIKNEEYDREQDYELLKDELKNLKASPSPDPKDIEELKLRVKEAAQDVNRIKAAVSKVTMSDEAMDDFIALETKHPELRTIMDNWGALNQNLLKLWLSVGLLSKGRYDVLSKIKDYVPWQRIMTDEEDIHSPIQTTNRTLTDIGKEKLFTLGKPRNIIDFVAEAGQQKFKIQPSSIVYVEINGDAVAPTDFTFTPSGEVTINVPIAEGDLVVFDTKREIENIIDNMTRNAMRMVMNGIRQYAALRIVKEYATRDEKNKIKVFPKEDQAKGRFNFIASGQRIVVEIKNPLIAEAIFGMEKMHLEAFKILAVAANFTRRTITLSGAFQIKQVFKDAPAAAFVTGVKNPAALLGGAYKGFVNSLFNTDPVVDILTQAGIGGFVSSARTPEADIKRRIGTINSNVFDKTLRVLDHIGDASDMAQRVAIYKQVMADTKDPAEALYRANNVINFRRHGSSTIAQLITRNVMFASAAAQSVEVLAQALAGGGLRGMKRKKALGRLLVAGTMLSTLTLLYCFAVGDDDDYEQMDDQTKLRNFMIRGTKILLPMNTGAAFFFKAIPELLYNKVMKQGTNTEMDMRRLKKAAGEAFLDMMLGPEPIPTGLRPFIEIGINHNFFTGRPVTPRGAEDLEKAEQYTASTSELAKMLGSEVLSPIEIDHLIRGLFGSAGAMAQWSSNVIGQATRPEMTAKDYPIVGAFVRSEALRGREELFYDLAGEVKTKYKTWQAFMDRDEYEKADAYSDKNGDLVELMKYINQTEAELAKLNKVIRYYGETTDPGVTPKERREEIRDAQRDKNDLLEDVYEIRRDAGF